MPTAIPVASSRPDVPISDGRRRVPRPGRLFTFAISLPIAWALVILPPVSGGSALEAQAASDCSAWSSLTQPPNSIRVLRRRSGRIDVVPFRKYVITVMGREWPSYLPQALVEAGAVTVKQYAWYHAVYSSRSANGRCYDVRDGVTDQLYKPGRARISPDIHAAVDATWNVVVHKNGQFLMTGFRRGEKVRCGRDATGYKLYARSGVDCARRGQDWRQILRTYYGPGISLVGDGESGNPAPPPAPPETSVAPPAPPIVADTSPVGAAVAVGAVGGGLNGGLAESVMQHEQRMLLLWLASNSLV